MATDLKSLYMDSSKARVKEARQIPGLAVNFFDRNSTYQTDFTTFQKLYITEYTNNALNYFDKVSLNFTIPTSFVPVEQGISLNRWNSKNKYYHPGQTQG